jgi:hypothetical protein
MSWRLDKWCNVFADNTIPMTKDEQNAAQTYLRISRYEKPEDCPDKVILSMTCMWLKYM